LGCQIPVANGIQLLQEILHFGGTSTPIIFVTGKGVKIIAAQALKAGVLDYTPYKHYPRSFISMYPKCDQGSGSGIESQTS
jgi:FixJ family two-component response regulator